MVGVTVGMQVAAYELHLTITKLVLAGHALNGASTPGPLNHAMVEWK